MKITVLGAGGWGTALARLLHLGGAQVTLWGHNPALLEAMAVTGYNARYLPGIELPKDWRLESNLERSIESAECVVVAVPSGAFREVATALHRYSGLVVSVTKGIEHRTGLTMCGIVEQTAPHACSVALSGPTLALEVAREIPSAIVAGSFETEAAERVQQLFHRPFFRVYTNADRLGVELGGALKNVVAIAAGMCDGLGFGDNSKAALITRAMVEIRRLGVACGAQPETFSGLSGLGDLTVTCFSRLSRNRCFGERLGRGEKLAGILESTATVAEGFPTARSAYELSRHLNVSTPLIDEVYYMLYEGKDVIQAVRDLTHRNSKSETWT
jgi:glycerol-3-phosphate dehydrogenase (NAD(P)+)